MRRACAVALAAGAGIVRVGLPVRVALGVCVVDGSRVWVGVRLGTAVFVPVGELVGLRVGVGALGERVAVCVGEDRGAAVDGASVFSSAMGPVGRVSVAGGGGLVAVAGTRRVTVGRGVGGRVEVTRGVGFISPGNERKLL